ncbi:protein of unknown function DUF1302 [Parvibaculum lavamentivorans DS-1]|uniref:DUF1302 domain-containing protein n=1 Tax=Parvibaculum lavamentivorans (strain DS-1 / DSM 13023 / NCIMB 13966) TaxID=402881 RepID=A7HRW2_PARL1|nr:protein of unknown function DUF1302 [Parvibaculum lavamentivorans DS-1]
MKKGRRRGASGIVALTTAVIAIALSVAPASAVEYKFGDATLSIDSIASTGITVRASKQGCMYIRVASGGCLDGTGNNASANTDDGNINFEQWDITNASVKIVSDFELRWENFGAFTRFKAYYDHIIYDRAGESSTAYGRRPTSDALRGDDSRRAGRGFDVLDAFVFADFDVGNMPTSMRVGKQVINWGESLAIQGGINQFNSIDVAAIRTPGAELKEALLPEESVYVNVQLPADLSFEAFYAFNWRQTELDPVGTFFSGTDILGPGGAYLNIGNDTPSPINAGTIPIAAGDTPDKQGQYGVKLGHWADWLNQGTELALYYVNYHSKLPYVEFTNGAPASIDGALCFPAPTCGLPLQNYRAAYPEDIKLVGTSFATTVAGTALAGEVLYSWNMPMQISAGELLAGRWVNNIGLPVAVLPYDQTPGAFSRGYFREDVINGQFSTITTLNPSSAIPEFFGADLAIFIANWGFQYLPSISDDRLSVLSGGRGSDISHPNPFVQGLLNPNQQLVHADTFSHGYRLIGAVDYNNAFGTPWKLSPNIQWQHDLATSAGTIGPGFINDRKIVSVGVTGELRNVWRAEVRYTNSFGNRFQNVMQDRDFISMSVSYAF